MTMALCTKVAIRMQTPHKYSAKRVFALVEGRGEIGNFPKSTVKTTIGRVERYASLHTAGGGGGLTPSAREGVHTVVGVNRAVCEALTKSGK